MGQLWEKLIAVLNDILNLYQAVLELATRKRAVLVAADVKELEAITKQEEALILQIGKLEKLRAEMLSRIAAGNKINSGKLTLTQIKQFADEKTAEQLAKLGESLKNVAGELAELNGINTQLIKQAIFFVDCNMNILARNVADPVYVPHGQENRTNSSRAFIDRKV